MLGLRVYALTVCDSHMSVHSSTQICRPTTGSKVIVATWPRKQAKAKMMMQTLTAQLRVHQQMYSWEGKQMALAAN